MEIEFCDLCNESVPVSDFALGRAFRRKGRVVCARCDSAMGGHDESAAGAAPAGFGAPLGTAVRGDVTTRTGGGVAVAAAPPAARVAAPPGPPTTPEAPPQRSRSGAFGAMTGFLALVAVLGAGVVVAERLDGLEAAQRSEARDAVSRLDGLRSQNAAALVPLRQELAEARAAAKTAGDEARRAADERLRELEGRLDAAAAREAALLSAIEGLRSELEGSRGEVRALAEETRTKLENVENLVAFHDGQLVEVKERIREAGALVAAGIAPAPVAGPAQPAAWEGHLVDLGHSDPALRLDAVSHLAETGDPAVVPHILPLLGDSDLFVRMVVAQALGDLDARVGVSPLIDRLEDESVTVREAAVLSLRRITGRQFGFEPDSREVERRKRVEAWRAWWRKSGDDFLTS